jgi:hypothetical protein
MTMQFRPALFFLVCSAFLLGVPQAALAACDQTLSPGANIATAVSSVAPGGTVCLNAGSYPAFNSTISKSSMTTVTAAPGVSQSQVTIASVNVNASQYLKFANMTIGGAGVGTGSSAALHISFVGIRFTGSVCINNPTNVNQDTLVDSSTFAGVGQGCTEGRLGVTGNNINHSVSSGIVISNSVFGPGGCSDGIQIIGGARGVQVLNNEFVGIKQGSCSPVHADPIQFYGAVAPVITGNYFHGNSTGIMSAGCNGSQGTYTNNVFVTDGEYPDQIVQTGSNGGTYDHNTFANGASIRFGDPNGCGLVTNVAFTNNIVTGGMNLTEGQTTSTFTRSFNYGAGGSNAIRGTLIYLGGTSPSTWAGWQLAAGSAGKNAGSDGLDIGSNSFGSSTSTALPPAPATNVRVVR